MNERGNSTFNRSRPLLERKNVPCEVIAIESKKNGAIGNNVISKRREYFTLRLLEGYRRSATNEERSERAIRLELSDEYRNHFLKAKLNNNAFNEDYGGGNRSPFSPIRDLRRHHDTRLSFNSMSSPSPHQAPLWSTSDYSTGGQSIVDSQCDEMARNNFGPLHLYELEVGESDFAALQQDQALRVDFSNFSKSFINLLRLCDLGADDLDVESVSGGVSEQKEELEENTENIQLQVGEINPLLGCQLSSSSGLIGQSKTPIRNSTAVSYSKRTTNQDSNRSMYTCRLEEYSSKCQSSSHSWQKNCQNNTGKTVRFSIVESNQFRELTHISLNLQDGTDASIRSYLSLRLSETLGSIAMLKYQLKKENSRAFSAERSCTEITTRFNELVAKAEKEKNDLAHEADEIIHKQNAKNIEDLKALKEKSEKELHAFKESSSQVHRSLISDIDQLKNLNGQLKIQKNEVEKENQRLNHCLTENEERFKCATDDLKQLQANFSKEQEERNKVERQLEQTQETLSSFEKVHEEKGRIILEMEEKLKNSSEKAEEAHGQSESVAVRLHATEQELNAAREELNKTKDLLSRYQHDRQEMKRRMKSKVELIQKQEEILASKELNSTETQQQLEQSEKELSKIRYEMNALKVELENANKTVADNKKTLESNDQVSVHYLYRK